MSLRLAETIAAALNLNRLRFVSWSVLAISVALLAISFATSKAGSTLFGTDLGHDYACFYVAGWIANDYGAQRLYDNTLHYRLYHELLPSLPPSADLPYWHPPFLSLLFRPLARLPYAWSYGLWLLITLGFYLAGLALVGRTVEGFTRAERWTTLLLALSFEPFVMECWIGGQLATFGFFWLALALYWEGRRFSFASGLALGVCLYKPTLLVLIAPMLLVARRWKTLAGFTLTGLALGGLSLLAVGWKGCQEYMQVLRSCVNVTTGSRQYLPTWKYVDLVSFARPLPSGYDVVGWLAIAVIVTGALWFLIGRWRQFHQLTANAQRALWSGTVTATLVLNLYVGIYDATIAVLGALFITDILRRKNSFAPSYQSLLVLLYVVPWFSQFLARVTGVQLYTLVLAGCALYQLRSARREFPASPSAV